MDSPMLSILHEIRYSFIDFQSIWNGLREYLFFSILVLPKKKPLRTQNAYTHDIYI